MTVDPVLANAGGSLTGFEPGSITAPIKLDVYHPPQQHNRGGSCKRSDPVAQGAPVPGLCLDLSRAFNAQGYEHHDRGRTGSARRRPGTGGRRRERRR